MHDDGIPPQYRPAPEPYAKSKWFWMVLLNISFVTMAVSIFGLIWGDIGFWFRTLLTAIIVFVVCYQVDEAIIRKRKRLKRQGRSS